MRDSTDNAVHAGKVRFGVYLDQERRKELLLAAIESGKSATKIVENLIERYLRHRRKRATKTATSAVHGRKR